MRVSSWPYAVRCKKCIRSYSYSHGIGDELERRCAKIKSHLSNIETASTCSVEQIHAPSSFLLDDGDRRCRGMKRNQSSKMPDIRNAAILNELLPPAIKTDSGRSPSIDVASSPLRWTRTRAGEDRPLEARLALHQTRCFKHVSSIIESRILVNFQIISKVSSCTLG